MNTYEQSKMPMRTGSAAQGEGLATTRKDWEHLPVGAWFYCYSPECTFPHSVQERTGSGCTSVCSSPWRTPDTEAQMRSIADTHNAALASQESTLHDWHGYTPDGVWHGCSLHPAPAASQESTPERCTHCGGTKDSPMPLSGAGSRCFDKWHRESTPGTQPLTVERARDLARSYLYGVMGHLGISELKDKAVESVADRLFGDFKAVAHPPSEGKLREALQRFVNETFHQRVHIQPGEGVPGAMPANLPCKPDCLKCQGEAALSSAPSSDSREERCTTVASATNYAATPVTGSISDTGTNDADMSSSQWKTVIVGLPIIRKLLQGENVELSTLRVSLIPDDVLWNARLGKPAEAAPAEPINTTMVKALFADAALIYTIDSDESYAWLAEQLNRNVAHWLRAAAPALDGQREALAKAIYDHERTEEAKDNHKGPDYYAPWPSDSQWQPYCQWAYRAADAVLRALTREPRPQSNQRGGQHEH